MHKIVEVFESIQSEGMYAGTAATFIRFYGCDRQCDFGNGLVCDEPLHTEPIHIIKMSTEELVTASHSKLVVITGGEPTLYDLNDLIKALQGDGHIVSIETNGYSVENRLLADHITYSPKHAFGGCRTLSNEFTELKLLAGVNNPVDVEEWKDVRNKYVQPIGLEEGWDMDNVRWCAQFVIDNKDWKLSLQTHKLMGID